MFYQAFETNPVETPNSIEPWSRFQVVSVPLLNSAKLVLGDKRTLRLKKGGR